MSSAVASSIYSLDFYNNTVEYNNLRYESHKRIIELIAIDLGHGDKVDELVDKFLGQPLKFKKRKDPNLTKKQLSAYIYYCASEREKIKKKFPDMKMTQISKELGKSWFKLPESKKVPFMAMHDKDRERYSEEMELYEQESIF